MRRKFNFILVAKETEFADGLGSGYVWKRKKTDSRNFGISKNGMTSN